MTGLWSIATCAVLFLSIIPARAQDEPAPVPQNSAQLEFVPPPMTGTISLGIYDARGKLVRVLYKEASASDLKAGTNGFIITWDGRDDAGDAAPAGRYSAHGFMAGDFDVEGVADHFNDWVTDDDSPRIRRVHALRPVSNGGLMMIAETGSGASTIIRFDAQGAAVWNQQLPSGHDSWSLALNSRSAFAAAGGVIIQYALEDGSSEQWKPIGIGIAALAADEQKLLVAGSGAALIDLRDQHCNVLKDLAGENVTAVTLQEGAAAFAMDGKVVVRGKKERKRELHLDARALDLAAGSGGTLWMIVEKPEGGREVRQYSRSGEFQRRLAIDPGAPAPRSVSASGAAEEIYLIEESATSQRVRGLALSGTAGGSAQGPPVSTWKVLLDKTITQSGSSAAILGKLEFPDHRPFAPQESIRLPLQPNPLLKEQTSTVEVRLLSDETGAFLALPDGLPLKHLTETENLRWVLMGRESDSDAITFFQGDGAVVEEFSASRLGNMMAFDCGTFDYVPGK